MLCTRELLNFRSNIPKIEDEAKTLQYVNNINDLMPKFIHQDKWQIETGEECNMLVIE